MQVVGGHASARLVQFAAEYAKVPQVSVCVWVGVAGTIQEAVADYPALHSRLHLVLRGFEFWFS